jgi:hypothetical protein
MVGGSGWSELAPASTTAGPILASGIRCFLRSASPEAVPSNCCMPSPSHRPSVAEVDVKDRARCSTHRLRTLNADITQQLTRKPPKRSHWLTKKGALFWKPAGIVQRGCVLALTGQASKAVHMITAGITAWRSTGATLWLPLHMSHLASAYAELGNFDDAWRCIGEATTAVETAKEKWFEAEVHRTAGEIALKSPELDAAKAEAYFERALVVARQQQAKSWELRAAMSMARLWRDRDKWDHARDLLAPIYGWFTEGFDTLDLKEARALLHELAS